MNLNNDWARLVLNVLQDKVVAIKMGYHKIIVSGFLVKRIDAYLLYCCTIYNTIDKLHHGN